MNKNENNDEVKPIKVEVIQTSRDPAISRRFQNRKNLSESKILNMRSFDNKVVAKPVPQHIPVFSNQ